MKSLFTAVAASTILAVSATLPASVWAGPQTLELDFATGNRSSLFPAGSDSMRIVYDNGSTARTISVAAGMFSGVAVEGANTTIDTKTLFENLNNVLAYCVDILQFLQANAVYEVENVTQDQIHTDYDGVQRNFGRMLSFLGAVNTVQQDVYGLSADSRNWLRPADPWVSGAIQLGIWESLYENKDNQLSVRSVHPFDSQWFRADVGTSNAGKDVDTRGLTFLDSAFGLVNQGSGFVPVSATEVLWARNTGGQDLIIDPVGVPIPGTGLLLVAGALVLRLRHRCN